MALIGCQRAYGALFERWVALFWRYGTLGVLFEHYGALEALFRCHLSTVGRCGPYLGAVSTISRVMRRWGAVWRYIGARAPFGHYWGLRRWLGTISALRRRLARPHGGVARLLFVRVSMEVERECGYLLRRRPSPPPCRC